MHLQVCEKCRSQIVNTVTRGTVLTQKLPLLQRRELVGAEHFLSNIVPQLDSELQRKVAVALVQDALSFATTELAPLPRLRPGATYFLSLPLPRSKTRSVPHTSHSGWKLGVGLTAKSTGRRC